MLLRMLPRSQKIYEGTSRCWDGVEHLCSAASTFLRWKPMLRPIGHVSFAMAQSSLNKLHSAMKLCHLLTLISCLYVAMLSTSPNKLEWRNSRGIVYKIYIRLFKVLDWPFQRQSLILWKLHLWNWPFWWTSNLS